MTISRWKVMACTLGLSLGGLAICAGQSNDKLSTPSLPSVPTPQTTEPAPLVLPVSNKPALPPAASDTQPPIAIPATPIRDLDIAFPVPTTVAIPDGGTVLSGGLKSVEVKAPEALPMPRTIELSDATEHALDPLTIDSEKFSKPTIAPPAATDLPNPGTKPIAPPRADSAIPLKPPLTSPPDFARPLDPPSVIAAPPPVFPPEPLTPAPPPTFTSPLAPVPPPPIATPAPLPPQQIAQASKLKMLLRLGDGAPRFEIRSTDGASLLLKVYGDKVEMQSAPEGLKASPITGVTANGKVRFVGPGIEGNCDQLSILSGTGEVLLKGNIHMKTKRGKAWSEMTAEKMIYQIGTSGLAKTTSPSRVKTTGYSTAP